MKILENKLTHEQHQELKDFLMVWRNEQDEIELQTSGSTGQKKIIAAKKRYLKASAKMTLNFFNLSEKSTILHCMPFGFIAGKMMLIRILESKAQVCFAPPTDPLAFETTVSIDFAAMTPYQYAKCLEHNPKKLEQIKTILLGGGAVNQELETQIRRLNHNVYHSYGMTETYSHVALRKIGQQEYFTALNGIKFGYTSEKTLLIHAPHLGIYTLETNDIVALLDPYQFRFVGRKDFVINSGGIKFHPEELEQKVATKFGDVNYFFASKPDPKLGEALILLIEADEQFTLPDLSDALEKYERPKEVLLCKKFVYTASGKLDRLNTLKTCLP